MLYLVNPDPVVDDVYRHDSGFESGRTNEYFRDMIAVAGWIRDNVKTTYPFDRYVVYVINETRPGDVASDMRECWQFHVG